jgi:hypothetical protein
VIQKSRQKFQISNFGFQCDQDFVVSLKQIKKIRDWELRDIPEFGKI